MTLIPKFSYSKSNSNLGSQGRTLGELLGLSATTEGVGANPALRFPLQRVVARVSIAGDYAITELSEHYHNPHQLPLDVSHLIPVPASGAVIGFEIRAGDRISRGVCKAKQQAQADFKDARARGKSAALVSHVRDDQHRISLANVAPGTDIVVTLRIAERLRVDDGRFEYRLPTTLAALYVPADEIIGHDGPGTSPDTVRAPDASHRTPPILLSGNIPLDLEVRIASGVTQILPSIELDRTDDANDGAVILRPAKKASCNGDVVIRFWGRGSETQLRAYTDGQRTLVVVDPPADRMPKLERVREAVFVLDRSGSMGGNNIVAAKSALRVAIKQLTPTDRVQVIAFDHECTAFPAQPEAATQATVKKVLKWLDSIESGGGTDAMPALAAACSGPFHPGHVRTVLFMTDGHVANDEEIVAFTRTLDPSIRISVVGIGCATQQGLLTRLARLGGGSHAIITASDDIEGETTAIGAAMLGPIACGLRETREGSETADTHAAATDFATARAPDLFAGRAATLFIDGARSRVRITSTDGTFDRTCEVLPSPLPLGALWGRDQVERLEDRRIAVPMEFAIIDARIEALGIEHQLQTRMTSFIAVDEQSQVEGEAIEIEQPVEERGDVQFDRNCMYSLHPGNLGSLHHMKYSMASLRVSPVDVLDCAASMDEALHQQSNEGIRLRAKRDVRWELDGGLVELDKKAHMNLLCAATSTRAELQQSFEQLDRSHQLVARGLPADFEDYFAAVILILLEACVSQRGKPVRLPGALNGFDLSRTSPLWMQCMQRLQPLRNRRGWKGFIGATERGDFSQMRFLAIGLARMME